jgi:RNA polymerase sigma-70 factor (ECF subfamily)
VRGAKALGVFVDSDVVGKRIRFALLLRKRFMSPDLQSSEATNKAEWFTATHWSVVLMAGQISSPDSAEALEKLCRTYWYPLYVYVRRQGHSPHDAQDLTQEFFARLLARNYLGTVGCEKGKFRSFLLAALNHFMADERDRARAAKRGGGKALISLDEEEAETRCQADMASPLSPERIFDKRWATALLEQAFAKLREEFVAAEKGERFDRLKVFLEDGTEAGDYAAVGMELGMAANTVAAAVHRLRQRYRELVRAEIANTVASPDDIKEEMRHLVAALTQ